MTDILYRKFYPYIIKNKSETMELRHRLHQELIDMVDRIKNIQNRNEPIQVENVLCSTGIFTRLMNVFSGFSGMSIKISFEDEIRSTVLNST